MFRGLKRLFALALVLALLVGLLPVAEASAQTSAAEPQVLTQEDYDKADLVLEEIEKALSAPAKKSSTQAQKTQEAMQIVMASDSYVEGSLEQNGAAFTWWTEDGIRCMYNPRMQKIREGQKAVGADAIINEPLATKGGSPAGNQVYLVGPYYGYDENFTNQYKKEAARVAAALGDTDGYTLYSGNAATIDKVAEAVSNGAVVFFDSHGTTDYQNPNDEYDCITGATSSYLCLHTANGLTTQDYNDGAAYNGNTFVNGKVIANHMTKQSPNGFLWMAICLGMGTDSIFKPMREMGVEVVYGYSESVTFDGEYLWEETFWDTMLDGGTVAQAAAVMKETWGYWDWSGTMAQYYGYSYYEGYTTLSQAQADFSAFPVVVSDEDTWPGKRTKTNYGASSLQTVKSTYTLGELQEVTIPTDPGQILTEAYALSPGQELPYTPTLTGTVKQITTAYSTQHNNITLIMEVDGYADMPIKCYRLQGSGADLIAVGDTITVTGTVVNFQHSSGDTEVEFAQGCQLLSRVPAGEEPAPEEIYTVSFVVPAGVPAIADMQGDNNIVTLPVADSPSPDYSFAGWAKEAVSETTTPPALYNGRCMLTHNVTLYAVYVRTEGGDGQWNLVTSQAQLAAGSQVVIAAAAKDYALSTTQNNNNRSAVSIVKNGTILELNGNVQVFTLEDGTASGSFAFNTGSGYIYTSDTSSNRLRTQTDLDAYASFTLTVAADGVATIQNVGNTARGLLQFNSNNGSPLFSCYAGGQEAVALYAMTGKTYYTSNPVSCPHANTQEVAAMEPTCIQNGQAAGVYCTDCQSYIQGGEVIEAPGHSYATAVTPPTATEQGYTTYTCQVCGEHFTADYVPALGITYTVSFAVPQGVTAPASMACGSDGISLPTAGAPAGYTFLGWSETPVEKTEQKPRVYTGQYQTQENITLYAVYSITEGSGAAGFTLVTDASQLSVGSQVIIAAAGYDKAMSVTQNNNNRAAATIAKSGSTLTYGSDTVILELQAGTVSGSFAFYDAAKSGYLTTASSSGNYLRTGALSANASWKITVDTAGKASITAQGSYSRKVMQYNPNSGGSPLFACYSSASQKPVSLYVKGSSVTYYTSLDATVSQRVQVGANTYATLAQALQDASGDYITLLTDITENVTATKDLTLDLNGCVLTGNIQMATGTALYLFDSATADYEASDRGGILGYVDGLATVMNTPASYGHNYKYVTILEEDGSYSAHRIYLGVQSVKLTPANTGICYKTLFKCSDFLAGYVESFGVRVADREYTFTTSPVGGSNYGTINVGNILDARDLEGTAGNAYAQIPLAPVVTLKDNLRTGFEGSQVSHSLQDVVKLVNASFDSLTQTQQHALQYMYQVYAPILGTWDDSIVGNLKKSLCA